MTFPSPLAAAPPPPPTRVQPVTDVLHGVPVPDPYRWLEQGDAPEVQAWTAAQNAYLRAVLDQVPGRDELAERLWAANGLGSLGVPIARGPAQRPRLFFTRREPRQNQPVLFVRDGLRGGARGDRALVDVNREAPDGTLSLDWWYPSEDGRRLAYGTSRDGSEESTLRVLDVEHGRDLPDVIPHTRAASLAWLPDGSGFYYTRYPEPGSVPEGQDKYHRAVHFHALGSDPRLDPKVFPPPGAPARDLTEWPSVALSPDGRWLAITVGQGWARSEIHVVDLRAGGACAPLPVVTGKAARFEVVEVDDEALYVLTNFEAPRNRLLRIPLRAPEPASWRTLIAEGEDTLEHVALTRDRLIAVTLREATARVQVLARDGQPLHEVALPGLVSVTGVGARLGDARAFLSVTGFLSPITVLTLDGRTGKASVWGQVRAPVDPRAFSVAQVRYRSKDGTSVPMFVIHRKDLARDGSAAALLYGYGGFNISLTPSYLGPVLPFLEAGGVYAMANLRGGGEFGEAWHEAGMLGRKQNVFDDFIAAAEHLVAERFTRPGRLAISGRSNGGLLVAAALTQRPELFRAAVSGVPLCDMLRYPLFRIARLWVPEYGDPQRAEDFRWLHAYSPYHRVRDGVVYPATLLFSAESDTRVDALHARKMAARLQAANAGPHPILLRLEAQAGHGAGKPLGKRIEQYTDELAFLFRELEMRLPALPAPRRAR